MKAISVFCSSSKNVSDEYYQGAKKLAKSIVSNGYDLVWGGANIGTMGVIAKEVQNQGGMVRGVLPKALLKVGLEYKEADELIITHDMSLRKNTINEMSHGFICLPGGFGTLEEVFEVITLKQLKYFDKPIVILNVNGYYDKLLGFIDSMVNEKFVKEQGKLLYYVTNNPNEAVSYISDYESTVLEDKW